ncbi:hypothetical protein ES705_06116 [subsurface metagenome]
MRKVKLTLNLVIGLRLFFLRDILDNDQVIKIAESSVSNNQIYESHKGSLFTIRLLYGSKIDIPETLIKELIKKNFGPKSCEYN